MFNSNTLTDFLKDFPIFILVAWAAIAHGLATRFYAEARAYRKAIRDTDDAQKDIFHSLLERTDERTEYTLHYEAVRSVMGSAEAEAYHAEALRVTSKLGLKPGYYHVDALGQIAPVRASQPKLSGARRSKMSQTKRFRIFRRDGFRCQLCGRQADADNGIELHVDHKMPLSKGGSDNDANLWTLCNECNGGKSDSIIEEIIEEMGSLPEDE